MNIYLYFHAGSKNHGCEAIVKTTADLFTITPILISQAPDQDYFYKLDSIVNIVPEGVFKPKIYEKVFIKLFEKLIHSEKYTYKVKAKYLLKKINKGGIALSIGGDNYCYGKEYNWLLSNMNEFFHKKSIKTVLWGCSVEQEYITRDVENDFSKYDLITARESISYNILKKYNKNTILVADTAFILNKEELPLPKYFIENNTVGINISPLIQRKERISGITYQNYRYLIKYIIDETNYNIALIPHVIEEGNDDRVPLKSLYDEFKETKRIAMIGDCNAEQLKGYISRCSLFIGARTHATIAAYSTCIPTLVIGYSTKAKGIALDLFGSYDNYVLPVQNLRDKNDMINSFVWLNSHKKEIKEHLKSFLPDYKKRVYLGFEAIKKL